MKPVIFISEGNAASLASIFDCTGRACASRPLSREELLTMLAGSGNNLSFLGDNLTKKVRDNLSAEVVASDDSFIRKVGGENTAIGKTFILVKTRSDGEFQFELVMIVPIWDTVYVLDDEYARARGIDPSMLDIKEFGEKNLPLLLTHVSTVVTHHATLEFVETALSGCNVNVRGEELKGLSELELAKSSSLILTKAEPTNICRLLQSRGDFWYTSGQSFM